MSKDDAAIAEPLLTTLQVERLIVKNLPQIDHHQEIVEEIKPDAIRVRLPYKSKYMGPSCGRTALARSSPGQW